MTRRRDESARTTTPTHVSRRGLLAGMGAAGLSGLGTGFGAGGLQPHPGPSETGTGARRLAMAGERAQESSPLQLGIAGTAPAFVHVVSVDLAARHRDGAGTARSTAQRVLRSWSDQARRLHEEGPASVVPGAASAGLLPASLMVTVGIGGPLLDVLDLGARRPEPLADLPAYGTDDLRAEWSGGDLLLQAGAEDPMVLGAAVQHLLSAVAGQVRVRWSLRGFQRTAAAAADPGATPRNLMGQLDGTGNPPQDQALFDTTVRVRGGTGAHRWMRGGSYVVIRRIRMLLDDWYGEDVDHRERVIGRRLSNGAPLGRRNENDPVPLTARGGDGRPRIPADAHVRLSSPESSLGARMFRRGYSYDEGWRSDGTRDAGLLFMAWQSDPTRGFVPVQRNLDANGDALNAYIRHEGSALFAVPPAPVGDSFIGGDLFDG